MLEERGSLERRRKESQALEKGERWMPSEKAFVS